jgi:hypothetical protein
MVIWALSDNERRPILRALGGRMVARSSEKFGPKSLDKVASPGPTEAYLASPHCRLDRLNRALLTLDN